MPGGHVDPGETPAEAARREVLEETGLRVEPMGVTGVYFNTPLGLLNLVFQARLLGGELRTSEETSEVGFYPLTPETAARLLRREHHLTRVVDALSAPSPVPFEAFQVRPYRSLERTLSP